MGVFLRSGVSRATRIDGNAHRLPPRSTTRETMASVFPQWRPGRPTKGESRWLRGGRQPLSRVVYAESRPSSGTQSLKSRFLTAASHPTSSAHGRTLKGPASRIHFVRRRLAWPPRRHREPTAPQSSKSTRRIATSSEFSAGRRNRRRGGFAHPRRACAGLAAATGRRRAPAAVSDTANPGVRLVHRWTRRRIKPILHGSWMVPGEL